MHSFLIKGSHNMCCTCSLGNNLLMTDQNFTLMEKCYLPHWMKQSFTSHSTFIQWLKHSVICLSVYLSVSQSLSLSLYLSFSPSLPPLSLSLSLSPSIKSWGCRQWSLCSVKQRQCDCESWGSRPELETPPAPTGLIAGWTSGGNTWTQWTSWWDVCVCVCITWSCREYIH